VFASVGLVEELFPVVGILPTATLAWVKEIGDFVIQGITPSLVASAKGVETKRD